MSFNRILFGAIISSAIFSNYLYAGKAATATKSDEYVNDYYVKTDRGMPIKKVVGFYDIDQKVVEITNGEVIGLGNNVKDLVISKLYNAGVLQSVHLKNDVRSKFSPKTGFFSEFMGESSPPYAVENEPILGGKVKISIRELNFTSGERGDRQFFGFSDFHKNPWNDGTYKNEFPEKVDATEPSWFGKTRFYDPNEIKPYINSFTGMDIGGGFNINAVIFGVGFRFNRYHAEGSLDLDLEFDGRKLTKKLFAEGDGEYMAISGSYYGFSAELELSRKAAMQNVFNGLINRVIDVVGAEIDNIPYFAKIKVIDGESIAISGGSDQGMQVGDLFYGLINRKGLPNIFRVVSVYPTMSLVLPMEGENDFEINDYIRYAKSMADVPNILPVGVAYATNDKKFYASKFATSGESIGINLGFMKIDYLPEGYKSNDKRSWFRKVADGIVNMFLLAYRVYRFFEYDQAYDGPSEIAINGGWASNNFNQEDKCLANKDDFWVTTDESCKKYEDQMAMKDAFLGHDESDYSKEDKIWGLRKIRANEAWKISTGKDALIAMVDSGADYNHPDLRDNMYIDGTRLDFVSMDTRPFDDNYHGTGVASLIVGDAMSYTGSGVWGIAPQAKLMPIKIFNPWGITSSANIYSGILKAVDSAPIVILPWSVYRESEAIREALAYAQAKGVLVIVPAGDGGRDINTRPMLPATLGRNFDNLIVVGGSDKNDNIVQKFGYYSNTGNEVIDIAAPGQDLVVARPRVRYDMRTSTDFAAAYVAGTAALIKSHNPKLDYREIKAKIFAGADRIQALAPFVKEGKRLNAVNALIK